MSSHIRKCFIISVLFVVFIGQTVLAENLTRYLVEYKTGSLPKIIKTVESMGGEVLHIYDNIEAVAIRLPNSKFKDFEGIEDVINATKDRMVKRPKKVYEREINKRRAELLKMDVKSLVGFQALGKEVRFHSFENVFRGDGVGSAIADVQRLIDEGFLPQDYLFNLELTGAVELHKQGFLGQGQIVAVIDSGVANNPELVPTLAGSVIGGENFVENEPNVSATSTLNDFHGTSVGTTIAGHGGLLLPPGILDGIFEEHAPTSYIPNFLDTGWTMIPLIGSAPAAQLYSLKVFHSQEEFSPDSRILAAMDRALTLKLNYNRRSAQLEEKFASDPVSGSGVEEDPFVYDALDISVVNMSLGGPTTAVGLSLQDLMVEKMFDAGIVVVISAGNSGPTAVTVGSPATSHDALAVGAASMAAHERIYAEIIQPDIPDFGYLWRPSDVPQIAYFSSRGPHADGRLAPSVVSPGTFLFVQGADGQFGFFSGTSFSAPEVSGSTTLLRQMMPESPARSVRDAIKYSANAEFIPMATAIDQGYGFVDYSRAAELLMTEIVPFSLIPEFRPLRRVASNLRRAKQVIYNERRGISESTGSLEPGQVQHYMLSVSERTKKLKIHLSNLQKEGPGNPVFGDGLILVVQDAVTSDYYPLYENVIQEDAEIEIENPQTGVVRIAVMADSVNVGNISADLKVSAKRGEKVSPSLLGIVTQDEQDQYVIYVPQKTSEMSINLSWVKNWAVYPSDDLDVYLQSPNGEVIYDGATISSPERILVKDPTPGAWQIVIDGYEVNPPHANLVFQKANKAIYKLSVLLDGKKYRFKNRRHRYSHW